MSKKIDNLNALDWDDSALIKAYDKGMSLRVKDFDGSGSSKEKEGSSKEKAGSSKERKRESKKKEWEIGDYCRAVYIGDDLTYEAKIMSIDKNICFVEYLGYNEEMPVDINSLEESKGKKSRSKQIKKAIKSQKDNYPAASADESCDDRGNEYPVIHSPMYSKKKVRHHKHENHVFNHSVDCATAAESTLHHSMYSPAPCDALCQSAPPMPPCPNVAQNPSLSSMLTSWYMAGYYTALHEVAQKNENPPRCCCHRNQNYCHH